MDPRVVVVLNAAIPIAAIRCAAIQNVVILFEARVVAPGVALNAVLTVVRDVVRGVVIPIAATRCAATPFGVTQFAVDRCEANLDAMVDSQGAAVLSLVQDFAQCVATPFAVTRFAVDRCVLALSAMAGSQDEVRPDDGQGVSPVDLLSRAAVQIEVARDAFRFSVLLPVAQCAAAREYYRHRLPDFACCRDPDAHRAVDPVTHSY